MGWGRVGGLQDVSLRPREGVSGSVQQWSGEAGSAKGRAAPVCRSRGWAFSSPPLAPLPEGRFPACLSRRRGAATGGERRRDEACRVASLPHLPSVRAASRGPRPPPSPAANFPQRRQDRPGLAPSAAGSSPHSHGSYRPPASKGSAEDGSLSQSTGAKTDD